MKTLLLLRHAKSSWKDDSLDDHERPLNKRGKEAAPRVGELLVARQLVPDLVIASTAVRAQATAFAVMEASGTAGALHSTKRLYLAPPSVYLELLRAVPEPTPRVLMIGHNPGIEELVGMLAGRPEHMPTAALAAFTLDLSSWAAVDHDTGARLLGVWRPKDGD